MKRSAVASLGAALVATLGASSVAHAAMINFNFDAIGGSITYAPATSLDVSSALDLDDSLFLVSNVGPGDASGLVPFFDTIMLATVPPPPTGGVVVLYGDTPVPPGGRPLGADVVMSWTGSTGDMFTETLTTVDSIDRKTMNAITVGLSGTVSDSDRHFVDAPALVMLHATQDFGLSHPPDVTFANESGLSVPEISTWAMMALGFGALGCAASRRRKKNGAILFA